MNLLRPSENKVGQSLESDKKVSGHCVYVMWCLGEIGGGFRYCGKPETEVGALEPCGLLIRDTPNTIFRVSMRTLVSPVVVLTHIP